MRRILLSSLVFLILTTGLFAVEYFSVTLAANYLRPSDSGFREIYGSAKFLPELKVGAKIYQNFYLWTGFGYLKATGETSPDLKEESQSTQIFSSLGTGVIYKLTPKLGVKLEAGVLAVQYKEEALGGEISDWALGFSLDGGLRFDAASNFFLELSVGYLSASDEIEGVSLKLGGIKAGLGIGIRF